MSFIFRALVVIGFLTYFAAQQRHATRPSASTGAQPVGAPAAWTTLPSATREKIPRESSADLARRFATLGPSQDTLVVGDRRPAWRGIKTP